MTLTLQKLVKSDYVLTLCVDMGLRLGPLTTERSLGKEEDKAVSGQ
jgi:hypothetical protein